MRQLTGKQELFVREYLVDLNATAASLRAGYSDGSYGRQLITKPHVEAAIQEQMNDRSRRTEITADRVLEELGRIGFSDIRELFGWGADSASFVPSSDLSAEQASAISSVRAETTHHTYERGLQETKIKLVLKLHDKLGALREIGKHLGIADRLELSGQVKTSGVLLVPSTEEGAWGRMARDQQSALERSAANASAKAAVGPEASNGNGTGA